MDRGKGAVGRWRGARAGVLFSFRRALHASLSRGAAHAPGTLPPRPPSTPGVSAEQLARTLAHRNGPYLAEDSVAFCREERERKIWSSALTPRFLSLFALFRGSDAIGALPLFPRRPSAQAPKRGAVRAGSIGQPHAHTLLPCLPPPASRRWAPPRGLPSPPPPLPTRSSTCSPLRLLRPPPRPPPKS